MPTPFKWLIFAPGLFLAVVGTLIQIDIDKTNGYNRGETLLEAIGYYLKGVLLSLFEIAIPGTILFSLFALVSLFLVLASERSPHFAYHFLGIVLLLVLAIGYISVINIYGYTAVNKTIIQ